MQKEASKQINQEPTTLISKLTREFVPKLTLRDYGLGNMALGYQVPCFQAKWKKFYSNRNRELHKPKAI